MKSKLSFLFFLALPFLSFGQEKSVEQIYYEASELYTKSEFQKAIDLLNPGLETLLNQDNSSKTLFFQYYNLQALCNTYLSKYEDAVNQFKKALEIVEELQMDDYYFRIVPNYAVALSRLGKSAEAEKVMLKCMSDYEIKNGNQSESYANMLNVTGVIYYEINNYGKSIELLERAKATYETYLDTNSESYNSILLNLATVYNKAGENEKADAIYGINQKEILKDRNDSINYTNKIMNYSNYLSDIGDLEQASKMMKECKILVEKIHGKKSFEYSIVLGNLGSLLTNMNRNSEAEQILVENVRLRAEIYGIDHPMYATALNNLGNLYNYIGKYSQAERLYLECLKIREAKLGKNSSLYANIIHNLAYLYDQTGKYEKAMQYYKESLTVNRNTLGTKHFEYRNNLNNICSLYWKMGILDSAEVYFKLTDKLNNEDIIDNFSYLSEKQKENYLTVSFGFYRTFKGFAFEQKNNNPAIVGDIYNDELMQKGIILSSNNAMRNAIETSNNPELKTIHQELLNIKENLNKQYSISVSERTQNTDSLELLALKKEKELNKLLQDNGLQKFMQNKITWQDIQKKLKSDEVAIEFCNFNKRNKGEFTDSVIYCALILTKKSKYPEMVYLFEQKEMELLLKKPANIDNDYYYIAPIYKISPNKISKSDSLFEMLWKPIVPFLGGAKRIFLSPVGILHGVSFAAIPIDDKRIITDKYELIYLSNTKNVLSIEEQNSIENVLVYGGIDYNTTVEDAGNSGNNAENNSNLLSEEMSQTRSVSWDYLGGTLIEADTITEMFLTKELEVKLLTDENATEESFKALNNHSPNVIHIATHGFFFPDNEIKKWSDQLGDIKFITSENPLLRSGLMFAGGSNAWNGYGPRNNSEDGVLTAYEISNLNLSSTKLVVLSACQTGLGEVAGNEGVYGLRRAFKMAGVDYMIMSLWSIPDKQTTELMTSFYINLLISNDIPEAFHKAQQELRSKYSAFGWAAFVLIY